MNVVLEKMYPGMWREGGCPFWGSGGRSRSCRGRELIWASTGLSPHSSMFPSISSVFMMLMALTSLSSSPK